MTQTETSPKKVRGRSRASIRLIQAARDFLREAHPTTVRGVCYHLFVVGVIPSMAKAQTGRVSRLLTAAREDGTIPWRWIVDETRDLERPAQWNDPEAFIETVRRAYRRDSWSQQTNQVEVWSEKGTVRGVLASVLDDYGVGFRVLHGFSSATLINDVAKTDGVPIVALYVGDWDPSGLYMSEVDLPTRLSRYGAAHVTVIRVALMREDLEGLPSFPVADKIRDPRYRWFVEHYGGQCWEVDAMHPDALRERVEMTIGKFIEWEAWERCCAAQQAEQDSLQSVLDTWMAITSQRTD